MLYGDTATFELKPEPGYKVKSVEGCGSGTLVGNSYTTGAVKADCTVIASFERITYTVSTQVAAGQGSFSPGSALVLYGDTTFFTVTPASGYSVQSVTGCGGTLVDSTYTTGAVKADCTVIVTFVLDSNTPDAVDDAVTVAEDSAAMVVEVLAQRQRATARRGP